MGRETVPPGCAGWGQFAESPIRPRIPQDISWNSKLPEWPHAQQLSLLPHRRHDRHVGGNWCMEPTWGSPSWCPFYLGGGWDLCMIKRSDYSNHVYYIYCTMCSLTWLRVTFGSVSCLLHQAPSYIYASSWAVPELIPCELVSAH